jgi:hypothetical protein
VATTSARLRGGRSVPRMLNRTIAFVADHIPAAAQVIEAGVIEAEMWSRGLTAGSFRLEGLIRATELLRMRLPFAMTQVNGERLVHVQDFPRLHSIVHVARRVVARYGIATVSEVAAKLRKKAPGVKSRNLVASVLAHERGFR